MAIPVRARRRLLGILTFAALVPALSGTEPLPASDPVPKSSQPPRAAASPQAWTLAEALAQLRLYPRDAYLQYVVMQLARREGKQAETARAMDDLVGRRGPGDERERPDLFSVFTGAVAVQESLQLETMRGLPTPDQLPVSAAPDEPGWRTVTETCVKKVPETVCKMVPETCIKDGKEYTVYRPVYETIYKEVTCTVERKVRVESEEPRTAQSIPASGQPSAPPPPTEVVVASPKVQPPAAEADPAPTDDVEPQQPFPASLPVSVLSGPTIKSHPWKKLLAGRTPEIDPLACCVPEDYYFVTFRSLDKLLHVVGLGDLWGHRLFSQATRDASAQPVIDRLQRQLVVETTGIQPFLGRDVAEVAITGSDLFIREGSDFTLLFHLKRPHIFRTTMEVLLARAEKDHPDARYETGEYLGIQYVHLATPDRAIDVYAADPTPELHVRSNSRVAFEHVLAAIRGQTAEGLPVRRLGHSREFAYIRTLMPRDAAEEDGFVYLSDPFIRRQVGPQLKLTERRRVQCYNHLRMIGHAALLFRTERGRAPASLAELVETGCCPAGFNEELCCPHGGCYALSEDGMSGVCSCHGCAHSLTPCCEIDLDEVTGEEAGAYTEFLKNYEQYWRSYFDPIALRLQVTPERYRLETIVLPLIDNSIYSILAKVLGGEPEPLDALPVPKKNILSLMFRFDKEALLKEFSGETSPEDTRGPKLLDAGLDVLDSLTEQAKDLDVKGFLKDGIGNQIGVHAYDHETTFYLSVPGLFGLSGGLEGAGIGLVLGVLNSPGYISVPVRDAKVVDTFLQKLDKFFAGWTRQPGDGLVQDFYHLRAGATKARGFTLGYGAAKFRVFWARIGGGLFIATKPFILDDIAAAAKEPQAGNSGPAAHAMFRVRAEHWNKVLADYRLAWAENQRGACLDNLGPLASVQRALQPGQNAQGWDTRRLAEQAYGVRFACPAGGRYTFSPDGKQCSCSIHGSALEPRQGLVPERNGLHELLRDFGGLTASLMFLKDGLRAVVDIERKPVPIQGEGSGRPASSLPSAAGSTGLVR